MSSTTYRTPAVAVGTGLILLVGVVLVSLTVGKGDVSVTESLRALVSPEDGNSAHITVRSVRLPRAMLAILVGAALALSGALVQTLTRNPLAEPGLLGITAGASFAVVVATRYFDASGQVATLVVAFVGAAVAAFAVQLVGRADPLRLLLAGVALTAVLAGLSIGIRLTDPATFDRYRFWSVGSLAGREQLPLLLPCLVLAIALLAALLLGPPLGAVMLGDDVAHGLGVKVVRVRVLTLLVATILAATATAVAGPIMFVGLIVPHVVRRFSQASISWLMLLCLVAGPLLTVAADILARVLLETGEVPVAILTAVIGGPVLIWVVRRHGTVGG
ncbi:iron ABC transporter permease [Nocardioides sp. AE5]|uniref:FecCD family ABC transporter permease n=1 Tax=Nocardioides sp. AE5 TaxID=2962573 RepID=UPI0028826656|nr:iron ABC transporter permease [Nocardioides sp. AE5]MDT0200887.1 iron ABC transporter permease [Nocardioides sp. AE5]